MVRDFSWNRAAKSSKKLLNKHTTKHYFSPIFQFFFLFWLNSRLLGCPTPVFSSAHCRFLSTTEFSQKRELRSPGTTSITSAASLLPWSFLVSHCQGLMKLASDDTVTLAAGLAEPPFPPPGSP